MKLEVLEWVANLKDVRLIDLLNDLRLMQSSDQTTPFSQEEMIERALRSEKDIAAGRLISMNEVRQEFLDED